MKILPNYLLILSLAISLPAIAQSNAPTEQYRLGLGGSHSCALHDGGVKCWGSDDSGQRTPLMGLKNPRAVAAAEYRTCALDDDGMKCWGHLDEEGEPEDLRPPAALKNSRTILAISLGERFSCAIDKQKVSCWGDRKWKPLTDKQVLKNPRAISAGDGHVCALHDDGVKCWGIYSDPYGKTKVPPGLLKNPSAVAAGDRVSCAIDDDLVKCWGDTDRRMPAVVSGMKNPRAIVMGSNHACALHDEGLKCWGDNSEWQNDVQNDPELINPRAVSAGAYHTCALGDNGVRCSGENRDGQTNVEEGLVFKTEYMRCTLNEVLDQTVFQEKLSVHEHPWLLVKKYGSTYQVAIGEAVYTSQSGTDIDYQTSGAKLSESVSSKATLKVDDGTMSYWLEHTATKTKSSAMLRSKKQGHASYVDVAKFVCPYVTAN